MLDNTEKDCSKQWENYLLLIIGIAVIIGIIVTIVLYYTQNAYGDTNFQHIPVINSASEPYSLFNNTEHIHSSALVSDEDNDLTNYSWKFLSCPSSCPTLTQARGS